MTLPRVFLTTSALSLIAVEARRRLLRETGGILIGYWGRSHRDVVITHATRPGPHARHGIGSFIADNAYCQEQLNKHFTRTKGYLSYLGDWHTHPWGPLQPSRSDHQTMQQVAASRRIGLAQPLLLIYRRGLIRPDRLRAHLFAEKRLWPRQPSVIDDDTIRPPLEELF